MLIGEPSPWNKDAAGLLQQFLEKPMGKVFLAQLAANRPQLSGSSDPHTVALQAKLVAGYELAILQIMRLTEAPEEANRPEQQTQYPDIDDESLWPKPEEKKE